MAAAAGLKMISDGSRARMALHPLRRRILESLGESGSASSVARKLELPRQAVNYHLRQLERQELVELVEERRVGNCTERLYRTTARSFVIAPAALGSLGIEPEQVEDRFSSTYLVALAARTLRDLAELREGADRAGKRLATFALDAEVRFATPADQHAFAQELSQAVAALVSLYHDADAPRGRRFRFFAAGHPLVARKSAVSTRPEKEKT